jgi:hypothetical protein
LTALGHAMSFVIATYIACFGSLLLLLGDPLMFSPLGSLPGDLALAVHFEVPCFPYSPIA